MHDTGYSRAALVAEARCWLGTPYRHQASLRGVGCDCLGLLRGLWRQFHGAEPEPLPAYTPDWAEAGAGASLQAAAERHLIACPAEAARPGDVLLFRLSPRHPAKHAGLLSAGRLQDGRFIHAHQGGSVIESRLVPWWRRRLAAAYRFPGVRD